ncbi:unnamed protein product [Cunninghamella blakesleeana]
MSLMENRPRSSSYNRKSHVIASYPSVTATLSSASPSSPPKHHSRRRKSNHRLSNASLVSSSSFNSFYSSSSSLRSYETNSSSTPYQPLKAFENIFSSIIDALIFTSAIAVTAYNYWRGYIIEQPRLSSSQHSSLLLSDQQYNNHNNNNNSNNTINNINNNNYNHNHNVNYHHHRHNNMKQLNSLSINHSLSSPKLITSTSPRFSSSLSSLSPPSSSSNALSKWKSDIQLDLKRIELEAPQPQTQGNVTSKKMNSYHHAKTSEYENKKKQDNELNNDDSNSDDSNDSDEEVDDVDIGDEDDQQERVDRMEETLQALIRQGQEALTS